MNFNFTKNRLVVIGLVISLLGLLYNFYRGYSSSRTEEISYLTNKVETIRKQLSIPLVNVAVFAASDVLSDEMLSKMPIIPSSIEISHLKGETAKKITVDVFSEVPIKNFNKNLSVEPFDVSYLDDTLKRIRIDIPELRKGGLVNVIVLTSKPPKFKINFYADIGELFDFNKEIKDRAAKITLFKKEIGYIDLWSLGKSSFKYRLSAAETTSELQLKLLEEKIRQLQDDNIFKAFLRSIASNPTHLFTFGAALLVLIFIVLRHSDKREYKILLDQIRKGKFELGDSIASVINKIGYQPPFIGVYDLSTVNYDLAIGCVKFNYFTLSKKIARQYRIFFKFKDSMLIEIEDSYQSKIILNSSTNRKNL